MQSASFALSHCFKASISSSDEQFVSRDLPLDWQETSYDSSTTEFSGMLNRKSKSLFYMSFAEYLAALKVDSIEANGDSRLRM